MSQVLDQGSVLVENRGMGGRTAREWFSSLPACILLLAVVLFSTSSDIHNKVLQLGQVIWSGYYQLRTDPVKPECNPNVNVDAQVKKQIAALSAQQNSLLGSLVASGPADPAAVRQSVINAKKACQAQFAQYASTRNRITDGVRMYRSAELFISDIVAFGLSSQRYILALLVLVCAATATFSRHHIAMRGMETRLDHTVSHFMQFIANTMLLISSFMYRKMSHESGAAMSSGQEILHDLWIVGFLVLTLVSLVQLFRVPDDAEEGGSLLHAFLCVPLYTTMTLISGTFFAFVGSPAGIGIYLDKMMELADMFLNVGLYVWAGMMLKQTRLASLVFNVLHPLKLPPEMLAVVAVMVAAIPTAYTGASGIFVIAAGAVIYSELRTAGARRQLALASTAMSGSLGVVLNPCLLVVVIAYLNRQVTTDSMFHWGGWVFMLTSSLFLLVSLIVNRQKGFQLAPASEALPEMVSRLKPLVPYVLVIAAVVFFYWLLLGVKMDEFSAPRILPIIMLGILIYEHVRFRGDRKKVSGEIDHQGLETSLRNATTETTAEIGALLLLFGLSVSIGGVIERSQVMSLFPQALPSPWIAMALMVVILIILGMIMDPFGAVILVSATIASLAYQSGINPVHFWMVTLVAFELGYLSPPVALNHLLTRQVVGEAEMNLSYRETGSFYQRHERVLMPLLVMGTALLIVAFVPLMFYAH